MSSRRFTAGLLGLATGVAGLAVVAVSPTAHANPAGTGLVISEVYGAGGNNNAVYDADFVELYNPTDDSLPLDGLAIHYRSAGGGSGGSPLALSGSVPAGAHWLIQMSATGANGDPLPTPDTVAQPPFNMAAAGGQVALQEGTEIIATAGDTSSVAGIVDFFGASGAASYEGTAGPAASAAMSANRSADGADTDDNAADFTLAAPTPTGTGLVEVPLEAVDPADVTAYVGFPVADIELAATGGEAPYSWEVTGLPAGLTESEDGVISGTPTTTGTAEVTATVTDSADPAATDEVTFTITVEAEPDEVTIAEIQGDGAASPLDGETVTTTGVVTAAYPTGGYDGFYIQTPGPDTTPGASDGIFVHEPELPEGLAVGDSVEVTGTADEYFGLTQLQALAITDVAPLGNVIPNDVVPGTECELPGEECLTGAALAAAREEVESETFLPTDPYTVTDVYDGSAYTGSGFSSSMFGEIGLAGGSEIPLVTPTEVIDAQDTEAIADRRAYNDAHRVILDDGSSLNYTSAVNQNSPFPYFTADHSVRVGAAVTFDEPVVLDYRFSVWRLQPQQQVVGEPEGITFEQTRAENALPADVGGDIKLATFNVLNYFPTTGVEWEGMDPANNECSYYEDRDGNIITTDDCGTDDNPGPRGAADQVNLERQEDKIVDAIVKLDADVVSLEEIENSVKFGKDRDFAVEALVAALNEEEGAGTWAYAPSPAADDLPAVEEQDVIRLAAIYKPASVELVGGSRVLDHPAFADAREPFAQAFKAVGDVDADAFAVIANHFKSKGSGVNDGTGQGNANPDRIAQAEALVTFAEEFQHDRGITRTYLTGDFNAYSEEDPIQVLESAGYTSLESTDDPAEETYNFDGMVGSLDHVLANGAALADVTGVDVWEINANESVYYEYSRFNYNATDLYGVHPFRSSDHNPEIVGIDVGVVSNTAEPTITGKAAVGKTLTGHPGEWDPEADDLAFQWLADGAPIARATGTRLKLRAGHVGKRISFQVTASADGYIDATATSEPTARVVKGRVKLAAKVTPQKVKVRKTRAWVVVRVVNTDGVQETGRITVVAKGVKKVTRKVVDGRVRLRLPAFRSTGKKVLTVRYSGNAALKGATVKRIIRVRR